VSARAEREQAAPLPIEEVAARLGLRAGEFELWGPGVAKVDRGVLDAPRRRPGAGRLVLVSAITPTPAGEGKTTISIGLGQGLARIGESACIALRQPSLGPAFGMKGGATGGGRAQLVPAERINLHLTGDFHAIASAHNLLASLLDNHLHHGNALGIDPTRILWRRTLDLNDRALRQIVVGLGGSPNGPARETGFDITAASEVMAMLCLADSAEDLRRRLDRTLVALAHDGAPVTASALRSSGALLALLADALQPNLVQTAEGTPALVHGGPFANIAHGCSSVIATRLAMHLADWTITEAGFGFDLGAEKFFDIKCRSAGLDTAAVVLVATVRALKLHGGAALRDLARPDPERVRAGLPNLTKHLENIAAFGEPPVVALNRFGSDAEEEIAVVREHCAKRGVPFAVADSFARGGAGAEELAREVVAHAERQSRPFRPLYAQDASVPDKIHAVASKMYGATRVVFTPRAERDLREVSRLGYAGLPVCIAKVPGSLSDDPARGGLPGRFDVTVREIQIAAGAGFLVVLTGDVMRMPGLPKHPLAESIDLREGRVVGLR
jgi:formate--tetrahydrofolate ligase